MIKTIIAAADIFITTLALGTESYWDKFRNHFSSMDIGEFWTAVERAAQALSTSASGQRLQQTPQDPAGGVDVEGLLRTSSPSTFFFDSPVSLTALLVNMAIGLALALVVQWHYRQFSTSLSNRENFTKIFHLVLLTTIVIITIVKSSLALSLGLVGALSIVRFRTPIKEPEELAYLFICIAIGLGLGANQTLVTVVGAAFILLATSLVMARKRDRGRRNLYLSVNLANDGENPGSRLEALNSLLGEYVTRNELRRVDSRDDALDASYVVEFASADDLNELIDHLHRDYRGVGVTFLDQSRMPGA